MSTSSRLVVTLFASIALLCAVSPASAEKLTDKDKEMIKSARRNLETGTQESRLARDRATDDKVQHFAQMATREQGELIMQLHELGNKHEYQYDADPTRPDVKGKKELESLKGKEFDHYYMSDMTRELEETHKIFMEGAKGADNDELRKWFAKNQDTIKDRLEFARATYREMKAKDDR